MEYRPYHLDGLNRAQTGPLVHESTSLSFDYLLFGEKHKDSLVDVHTLSDRWLVSPVSLCVPGLIHIYCGLFIMLLEYLF